MSFLAYFVVFVTGILFYGLCVGLGLKLLSLKLFYSLLFSLEGSSGEASTVHLDQFCVTLADPLETAVKQTDCVGLRRRSCQILGTNMSIACQTGHYTDTKAKNRPV